MNIRLVLLSLLFCGQIGIAAESGKRFSAMLGIGGPLFVLQASASGMINYTISQKISTEFYLGHCGTTSLEDKSDDSFLGVGFSWFPWGAREKKDGVLDKSFIRLAYSYHEIKQEYVDMSPAPGSIYNWIEKSHGIEVGIGVRLNRGNYVLEFIPLIFFIPLSTDIVGERQKDYSVGRVLNFKYGVRF